MRSSARRDDKRPGLFVVVDEAWKLAGDEKSDVVSIIREGRKYGFGLIVASQSPTDVHKSIFSNAGTTLCFRLTLASERDYVRSSLSYSGFVDSLSQGMAVGQALVHLEFSRPVSCPRTFILGKVEGEGLLEICSLRGDGMNLEFEKGSLSRRLLAFGLSDRQVASLLAEFERHSHSLEARRFVSLIEKLGHGRTSAISLLRELGAGERELLALFSAMGRDAGQPSGTELLVSLEADSGPRRAAQRGGGPGRNGGKRQRRGAARSPSRLSAAAGKNALRSKPARLPAGGLRSTAKKRALRSKTGKQ